MRVMAMLSLAACILVQHALAADSAKAPAKSKNGLLHLKVDFAPPSSKTDMTPTPGTAKEGWSHWVIPGLWDYYRSDLNRQSFAQDGPGKSGGKVQAAVSCQYEGLLGISVAGMRRYLAGSVQPHGKALYEPIRNSWISATDFPQNPGSDLLLPVYDLPPGEYRLVSYHNAFNSRRVGKDPTGVESVDIVEQEPPMPSIKAYSIKTIVTEYFEPRAGALIKGKTYGTPQKRIVIPGNEGSGNIKQTLEAKAIVIQQVKTDAELKPSVIEFSTDGSPVVVVYAGGCCKNDDLRKGRKGGYAILNAFELIQISDKSP